VREVLICSRLVCLWMGWWCGMVCGSVSRSWGSKTREGVALEMHTKHVTVRVLTFPNMHRFVPELNQGGPRDVLRLFFTKNGV